MIGAAAFFVLFITLIAGGIVGLAFTITSTVLLVQKKQNGAALAWIIGGIPSLIGWIIFLNLAFSFSPGGAPNAEDFNKMFKVFALAGFTPGIMLVAGGISQLIWFFIGKRSPKSKEPNQ